MNEKIRENIELFYENKNECNKDINNTLETYKLFLSLLDSGKIRAASRDNSGKWTTHSWIKKGILLGFRIGEIERINYGHLTFFEKSTLPIKDIQSSQNVRVVPGGTSIRKGAYLGNGVIAMPPAYVNIGAYVDDGTMIDSHALIGSCAQVGKNCHISAGVQIGGVIEPIGGSPVIIEDNVMIGGNSGIYEGIIVRKNAVIGSGTIINGSTPIYDLVNDKILRKDADNPILEIPENAVVVPGSRPIHSHLGEKYGLQVNCAIIVKYRDDKTDAKTALEMAIR